MKSFLRPAHSPRPRGIHHRRGFSLIEVIMATAILMGSVVMLSQLSGIGRGHADNTRYQAQAQRVCENTLNEIIMGLRPMVAAESAPLLPLVEVMDEDVLEFDDAEQAQVIRPGRPQDRLITAGNSPLWLHSIRMKPHEEAQGIVRLTVDVEAVQQTGTRRISFSLTRWIRQDTPKNSFSEFGGEL